MATRVNEYIFGHTIIRPQLVTTYLDQLSGTKQWLACIPAVDKKYGFKREFVKQIRQDHIKNIYLCYYELQAGKIYEFCNFYIEFGKYDSGFFAVNEQSTEIITLENIEVRKLLGMPVKDWILTLEEIGRGKNYANDDLPF